VEREAVVLPPEAQEEVLASRGPLPPQGSTSGVIDLTLDGSPSDKGKQEAVHASDRLGTSTASGGDATETSGGWPNFAKLALV
jgi:hypothetical protein